MKIQYGISVSLIHHTYWINSQKAFYSFDNTIMDITKSIYHVLLHLLLSVPNYFNTQKSMNACVDASVNACVESGSAILETLAFCQKFCVWVLIIVCKTLDFAQNMIFSTISGESSCFKIVSEGIYCFSNNKKLFFVF